ncbi:MAG TPA: serine/threonine-protein kinase, partial [Ktedonobacteraceae bacterium]|nr:serine/threonine-protein kinase [Ktedonobacteraceae bacterium]
RENSTQSSFCAHCGSFLRPLNGRYTVIEEVAKGHMGTNIYKAEDTKCFKRIVAIKEFIPQGDSPEARYEAQKNCEYEAELLSKLHHHSIPTLYDCFAGDPNWYMALEFIIGDTLENRWRRAKRPTRLSTEEIIDIGMQLCSVLQYLHHAERSIIFRDLKPSNIILDKEGHVYLIDFGSARNLRTGQTGKKNDIGTPGYAAPELAHQQASPRSDIYSLGATLFQQFLDRPLSGNTSYSEHFSTKNRKILHIPSRLRQLIENMTQEDENDRPDSVSDVKKELREITDQLSMPIETNKQPSATRRQFLLGGLAGVVSGTAVGSVAAASWFLFNSPRTTPARVVPFTLTVGGKLDPEATLLTEMYVLLLQDAGFHVTDMARLGTNDIVFNALKTGSIDIYPEFLLTGLQRLGIPTTHDQKKDFRNVQQGFESQYRITWLDQAVHLDDNYAVAIPRDRADQLGVKTLSELAQVVKSRNLSYVIAVAPDGESAALPALEKIYVLTFNNENKLSLAEKDTFDAVIRGSAQLNICIATDPLIAIDDFVRLKDDKGAFPTDTPSPIIRDDVLHREPLIGEVLNKLAPKLSVDVSTQLQAQILQGQSAKEVAKNWLKSQNLL